MFKNLYKDKVVLVTGHTGFKGSWLTLWLVSLGAKVVGVSNAIPTQPSMFETLDLASKIDHYFADINDKAAIVELVKKYRPNFLFHLAAQPIVSRSYSDPVSTIHTNVIGTTHILEALRLINSECTAILITSDKCYENVEWTWGYRENDRLGGKDPYSASKAGAEIIIHTYYHSFFNKKDSFVRLASTRAGNVIGGGDWAESRIVPDAIKAWAQQKPVIIRRPKATRPWQHVLEPLSGYLTLGMSLYEDISFNGESYNFGPAADQTFTVHEVLDAISENWKFTSDFERINVQEEKSFHEAGLLKLNCDKALNHLNWKPVLSFSQATALTANWYQHFYDKGHNQLFELSIDQIKKYTVEANKAKLKWAQS
jgi:CDP-glucose 4,6-dehydratase